MGAKFTRCLDFEYLSSLSATATLCLTLLHHEDEDVRIDVDVVLPESNRPFLSTDSPVHAQLSKALKLRSDYVVAGFSLPCGGPACPIFLLPGLQLLQRKYSSPRRILLLPIVIPRENYLLNLGPMAPLPSPSLLPYDTALILLSDVRRCSATITSSASSTTSLSSSFSGLSEEGQVLSRLMLTQLKEVGYVFIKADFEVAAMVQAAEREASKFFSQLSEEKRRYYVNMRDQKFAGFSDQGARQFMQLRCTQLGLVLPPGDNECKYSDPLHPHPWLKLFLLLQEVARASLALVAHAAGLDVSYVLGLLDKGDEGHLMANSAAYERFHSRKIAINRMPVEGNDMKKASNLREDVYVGSDVMRVYRYLRPSNSKKPELRNPATGLHADMGLLTVAPASSIPGLVMLHPRCERWIDVEQGRDNSHLCLFIGETLARLTSDPHSRARVQQKDKENLLDFNVSGRLSAPIHFVDERLMGVPRYSFPFFLRARPEAVLSTFDDDYNEQIPPPPPPPQTASTKQLQSHPELSVKRLVEETILATRPWLWKNKVGQRGASAVKQSDY